MSLGECRNNIDAIDAELLSLLNRRVAAVKRIAQIKKRSRLPVVDPAREKEVLERASADIDPISHSAIMPVFQEIINQSRQLQANEMAKDGLRDPREGRKELSLVKTASIEQAATGNEVFGSRPAPLDSSRMLVMDDPDKKRIVWVGDVPIGGSCAIVIAGPCSVESRQQIMETAAAVKGRGASILRGGAYKPRTSPYAFQGLGRAGLKLLREAGDASGLPVVTEIMSEDDVSLISDSADMLQIGARNMQNFALLKKLAKCGKPILLKRGPSATIDEWLSSAEYLLHGGNENVVLCERGVKGFDHALRNNLDLASVALVKELTHLPVIVDPSHATGRRSLISAASKAAIAVGADGIIVEVHPSPGAALSDREQQLTFSDFADLMADLESPLRAIHRYPENNRKAIMKRAPSLVMKRSTPISGTQGRERL